MTPNDQNRSTSRDNPHSSTSMYPGNFKAIIQFDRNNRPFYHNPHGYITYCDLEGNPIEFDRIGNQVFYDNTGYPFYYNAQGQAFFYDNALVEYDSNGYVIVKNLYGEEFQKQEEEQTPPPVYSKYEVITNIPEKQEENIIEKPQIETDAILQKPAEKEDASSDSFKSEESTKKKRFGKKEKKKAKESNADRKEKKGSTKKIEKPELVQNETSESRKRSFSILKFRKENSKDVFTSVEIDGASDALLSGVVDNIHEKYGQNSTEEDKNTKQKKETHKEKKAAKKSSKALKNKAKVLKIPKTVQDSIPYLAVYPDDGIIETEEGIFTKSYELQDVNYSIAKQAEQEEMFVKYGEFLNSYDPTVRIQITMNQRTINMETFEEDVLLKLKHDVLDELRIERNEMLKKKMAEGKNNLVIEKYITLSIQAQDIAQARIIFGRYDTEIVTNIKKIGGAGVRQLSAAERLEILHDIYNPDSVGLFGNNMIKKSDGEYVFHPDEKFSFAIMKRMGLCTKDCIGPSGFQFKSDHGMVGDKYFRALFMRSLPSFMSDSLLAELSKTECNMITSLHYQPVESEKAIKLARAQVTNVQANAIDKQKKASKAGYSADLINPELLNAVTETKELVQDLTHRNQKLFFMTFVIVHFADTLEQLKSDSETIRSIGRRFVCDMKPLSFQMENGLTTALPLGNNQLKIKRSLTTESAAIFMPFVNQELLDRDGGMYYGNNAVSGNLILFNRRNCKNGNGFIFGVPGSGKSFSAKQEMQTVLLSSDDDVIVIDPEGEYYPMADLLGGEVIRIAAGENNHINPLDINLGIDSEDDPIALKSDFMVSLCELIAGGVMGLNATQRSIIDRCVKKTYEPLLDSYNADTGTYDYDKTPTLVDFWMILKEQSGYDAMQLAESLEIYVTGSLNVFAHKTNVKYSERFVVYDIKDIGTTMKSMGLMVVLDNIWNRIVEGREKGKHVWFFIDEIYLLFKTESSTEFLRQLYKRARKYGGIPTGITQNVSDLLENSTARTMISNSEYLQMLSQAPLDRAQLGEMLNISPTQMGYITNSEPGSGLLYDGQHIVPFVNKLPKDTKAYSAMTTKLSEVKEREERQARESAERLAAAEAEKQTS